MASSPTSRYSSQGTLHRHHARSAMAVTAWRQRFHRTRACSPYSPSSSSSSRYSSSSPSRRNSNFQNPASPSRAPPLSSILVHADPLSIGRALDVPHPSLELLVSAELERAKRLDRIASAVLAERRRVQQQREDEERWELEMKRMRREKRRMDERRHVRTPPSGSPAHASAAAAASLSDPPPLHLRTPQASRWLDPADDADVTLSVSRSARKRLRVERNDDDVPAIDSDFSSLLGFTSMSSSESPAAPRFLLPSSSSSSGRDDVPVTPFQGARASGQRDMSPLTELTMISSASPTSEDRP